MKRSENGGPIRRFPTGYWHAFNKWWHAQYSALGARPSSKAIQRWHSEHAEEVWGDAAVSYQEVQRHANRMRCKRGAHDGIMQDVDDAETSEPEDEPGSTPERDRRTSASAPAPSGRALSRDPSYSLLMGAPRGGGGGQRRNGLAFYSGPTGARGGAAGGYRHESGDLGLGLGLGQLGALPPGVLASGPLVGGLAGDGLDGALPPPPLHALPYGIGGAGVSATLLGQLAAAAAAGTGERYPYGDGSEAWQDQVDPDEAEAATRLMALNPSHRSTGSIGAGRVLHLPAARAISLDGPGGGGGGGGSGIGFVSSSTPPPLPLPRDQQRLLLQALNGGGATGIGLLGEELGYEDAADEYGHARPYRLQAAAALGGSLDDQQQQESLLALQMQLLQQQGLGGGRALSATGFAAAAAAAAQQQQRLNSFRVKRQRGELDVDMQDVQAHMAAAGGGGALGLGLGLGLGLAQQQVQLQSRALSGLGALRLGGLALRPLEEVQPEAEADDDVAAVDMADGPVGGGGAAEWGRPPNRKTARLGGGVGGSGGSASAGSSGAGAGGVPADLQLQLQLLMLRQRQQQQQNEAGAAPMQMAGSPRLDLDLQADERYVQARADFGRRSVPSYAEQDAEQRQRGGLGPRAAPPGLVTLRPRADSGTRTVLPVSGGVGLEAQSLGGVALDDRAAPAAVMLNGGGGGSGFQRRSDPIDVDRDGPATDAWRRVAGGSPLGGTLLRGGGSNAAGPRAASTGATGNPSLMLPRGDILKHESGLDAIAAAAAAVAAAEDRDGGGAVDLAEPAAARSQQQQQLRALQQQQAQLTAALRELQEQQLAVEMRQQLQALEEQQQKQQNRQSHQQPHQQPHQQSPRQPLRDPVAYPGRTRDARGHDDEAAADAAAAMHLQERAPLPPADIEAEERVAGLRNTLLLLLQQRRAAEAAGVDAAEPGGVSLAPLRAGAAAGGTW